MSKYGVFFGPYFPAFGLKIRTRKYSVSGHFSHNESRKKFWAQTKFLCHVLKWPYDFQKNFGANGKMFTYPQNPRFLKWRKNMQIYGFPLIRIVPYTSLNYVHIRENLAYRKPLYLHILCNVQLSLLVNVGVTFFSIALAKFCAWSAKLIALCRTEIFKNSFSPYTINEWKLTILWFAPKFFWKS